MGFPSHAANEIFPGGWPRLSLALSRKRVPHPSRILRRVGSRLLAPWDFGLTPGRVAQAFVGTITKEGAPSFAHFAQGWVADCSHYGIFVSHRKRDFPPTFVHPHRPNLVERIEPITAPAPVLRLRHQTPLHGISVHVTKLLTSLLARPNVEIIKTDLPERRPFRSLPKHFDLARIAPYCFRQ